MTHENYIKGQKLLVIAFFTEGIYKSIMYQYLLKSLRNFPISYYIQSFPNKKDWSQNTNLKPVFAKFCYEKFKDHDILFVDADAEILEYPTLLEKIPPEYDLAVHYLNWRTWYKNNIDKKELLSGTLFFRHTKAMEEVIEKWLYFSKINSNLWEQKNLQKAVERQSDIKIYELPLSYCYIKTLPNGQEPYIKVENPIIVHNQVSRNIRRGKWKL